MTFIISIIFILSAMYFF